MNNFTWKLKKKREAIYVKIIHYLLRHLCLLELQRLLFFLEKEVSKAKSFFPGRKIKT
jgi:hypothetical protein